MAYKEASPEAQRLYKAAANRLHHLSMRYVGAYWEVANGKPLVGLPQAHPGLKEVRDLIDLGLLVRAEINTLTHCLAEAGVLDVEAFTRRAAEEYDWLTKQKCEFLGCDVSDAGLVYHIKPEHRPGPGEGWGSPRSG